MTTSQFNYCKRLSSATVHKALWRPIVTLHYTSDTATAALGNLSSHQAGPAICTPMCPIDILTYHVYVRQCPSLVWNHTNVHIVVYTALQHTVINWKAALIPKPMLASFAHSNQPFILICVLWWEKVSLCTYLQSKCFLNFNSHHNFIKLVLTQLISTWCFQAWRLDIVIIPKHLY